MHALTGLRMWVTGASSGIGAALAVALAKRGATVVITGRDEGRLQSVAAECPDRMACLPCDVSLREENARAAAWMEQRMGALDVAVLNAGVCEYVDMPVFDAGMVKRVMDVNFMGIVYGVEAALPLLRRGKTPYLVGMSSTVAYTGLPRAEAYGSSKAAIRYLMQSLRADLAPEGIDVSVVCPGFVRTPLTDRNDFPMPLRIGVDQAAECIVRGMARRRPEISFPRAFVWGIKVLAALPDPVRKRILMRMSPNRTAVSGLKQRLK